MNPTTLQHARIVVCDDTETNVRLLERMLAASGYTNVVTTTESSRVLALCEEAEPDLILLDLHMPPPDGFEVMRLLEPMFEGRWLPIVMLTADTTGEAKQRALSGGAKDFLTKPLDTVEVLLRIHNLLEARFLHAQLDEQNARLEWTVTEREHELDMARLEVLQRLALAAEYRDDVTGEHAQRVGRTSALLYTALGLPEEEVRLIRHAATVHDVGKIGIPDAILLKPDRLTQEEYEAVKAHVDFGYRILSGSDSTLLQMGAEIARTHHERWDGSGYPAGLSGEGIPLSGRVVAVADVFDALTHERPYKAAASPADALASIEADRGRGFDPTVVDAFARLDHVKLLSPVEVPAAAHLSGVAQSLVSAA